MRRALMTLNLYGDNIRGASRASFRDAATRWGAEYIESYATVRRARSISEKLALERHAIGFDRVVFCDRDVVIRKDCPSLFEIVPTDWWGAVPSEQEGHNLLHRIQPRMEPLAAAAGAPLDLKREYFNSGLLVFEPRAHARVFERARALFALVTERDWVVYDQGLISLAVKVEGVPLLSLPPTFNRCGAVLWHRWVPTMSDYVWHFSA